MAVVLLIRTDAIRTAAAPVGLNDGAGPQIADGGQLPTKFVTGAEREEGSGESGMKRHEVNVT